jgi:predicted transcriptional regulator YheO
LTDAVATRPSAPPSTLIERYQPLADGLAALLHPHVEVVLHDLATQRVVYIANNLSKRALGDESALDDIEFDPAETLIGPYEKTNWDGRRIRSVSVVARDQRRRPIGMICINVDLSAYDTARAALDLLLVGAPVIPQPEKLFRDDWQERINTFLQAWLRQRNLTLPRLDRHQKRDLVQALYAEGAFKGKSAPNYVAGVLALSRATIFNHLKAMKR